MDQSPQAIPPKAHANASSVRDWRGALLVLAIVLGFVYWLMRGPMRALDRLIDFPTFYSASRLWLKGANPYDGEQIQAAFIAAHGGDQTVLLSVNPPGLFPLMSPLSALPYPAAQMTMIALSLLATVATVLIIANLAGIQLSRKRQGLLLLGVLLLSPIHTSISQGQLTLFTLLLLTIALWGELRGKDFLIGVMLAVAVSLKPQMVVLFGPYYLLQGRWRVCAAGLVGTFGLLGISIGWMAWNGIDWWPAWMGNLEALTQSPTTDLDATGTGNLAILGNGRYIMTNLAPLLYDITSRREVVAAVVWVPAMACVAWLSYAMPRRIDKADLGLCVYACLGLLCLLTMYNRTYCLVMMLLVLGMILSHVESIKTGPRVMLGLLLCPLIVPGVALMSTLERGRLSGHWLTESWVWQWVLYPHWIYLQLATLAILLCWVWQRVRTQRADHAEV